MGPAPCNCLDRTAPSPRFLPQKNLHLPVDSLPPVGYTAPITNRPSGPERHHHVRQDSLQPLRPDHRLQPAPAPRSHRVYCPRGQGRGDFPLLVRHQPQRKPVVLQQAGDRRVRPDRGGQHQPWRPQHVDGREALRQDGVGRPGEREQRQGRGGYSLVCRRACPASDRLPDGTLPLGTAGVGHCGRRRLGPGRGQPVRCGRHLKHGGARGGVSDPPPPSLSLPTPRPLVRPGAAALLIVLVM